jgi:hypothetical protein
MGTQQMLRCVSYTLRKIAAVLQEDDTPYDNDIVKSKYTIENPITLIKVEHPESPEKSEEEPGESKKKCNKPLIDVQERDIREAKRPDIKPSRRQESHRSKWKGEGSREIRKDYQKQYRVDHGNT